MAGFSIPLFFRLLLLLVVLIICSLRLLHLHMARKYSRRCVCVVLATFTSLGWGEQLLFSHHNHKRYKHNYYFYVPATYCKAANCLTTHKMLREEGSYVGVVLYEDPDFCRDSASCGSIKRQVAGQNCNFGPVLAG